MQRHTISSRSRTTPGRGHCGVSAGRAWTGTTATILALSGLQAGAAGQTGGGGTASQPDIVFILTDDQGLDALRGRLTDGMDTVWPDAWNGWNALTPGEPIQTPKLSRFASQGVTFTNVRVNPNCSPTRGCLMTGRNALTTGLHGVITWKKDPEPGDELYETSMQRYEWTIAEVLSNIGGDNSPYHCILMDKWHVGSVDDGQLVGTSPEEQGFAFFQHYGEILQYDDPCTATIDDTHSFDVMEEAVDQWDLGKATGNPVALFFHTIDPHRRDAWDCDNNMIPEFWWEVPIDLAPLTFDYSAVPAGNPPGVLPTFSDVPVHKRNVEAIDTLIQELLERIGVVDGSGTYQSGSDTIVFFLSDNGTDPFVAAANVGLNNENYAKNTPYEPGIHVPCFVFGAGISEDPDGPLYGKVDDRLINHVDFFDTLADVAGATEAERTNPAAIFPDDDFRRDSISFADRIGYSSTVSEREFSVTSFGYVDTDGTLPLVYKDVWQVMMFDGRYKLICRAGGADMAQFRADGVSDAETYKKAIPDEFYDLLYDPDETRNLLDVNEIPLESEILRYIEMRDLLVNYRPNAVVQPHVASDFENFSISVQHNDFFLQVEVRDGELLPKCEGDYFADMQFGDVNLLDENCLVQGGRPTAQAIYNDWRNQVETTYASAGGGQRYQVVDYAATDFLFLENGTTFPEVDVVGHVVDPLGASLQEHRMLIKFDYGAAINPPPGFTWDNLVSAQIIVMFDRDMIGIGGSPNDDFETDTGLIRLYEMEVQWEPGGQYLESEVWDGFDATSDLGRFDPPPHVRNDDAGQLYIAEDPEFVFRSSPMPTGTPISFGHSSALASLSENWLRNIGNNYGVMMKANRIAAIEIGQGGAVRIYGDQRVQFKPEAYLRLSFDQRHVEGP